MLYNWKTAARIEAEFSLYKKAKRAENKAGRHHARSYHRFREIRLQFTSVRLLIKKCFSCISSILFTYTNKDVYSNLLIDLTRNQDFRI